MAGLLRATGMLFLLAAAQCPAAEAAPQQPATASSPSLERIRKGLEKSSGPRPNFDVPMRVPAATFKSGVEQRVYVPAFEEWLRNEFKVTALQRQSAEWASQCCGVSVPNVVKALKGAWQRRQVRKVREQIARELADLEARRKKAEADKR